jgi:hypothetical protein
MKITDSNSSKNETSDISIPHRNMFCNLPPRVRIWKVFCTQRVESYG